MKIPLDKRTILELMFKGWTLLHMQYNFEDHYWLQSPDAIFLWYSTKNVESVIAKQLEIDGLISEPLGTGWADRRWHDLTSKGKSTLGLFLQQFL